MHRWIAVALLFLPQLPSQVSDEVLAELDEFAGQLGRLKSLGLHVDDADRLRRLWSRRDASAILSEADDLIRSEPLVSSGHAVRYLALLQLVDDRSKARTAARQSLDQLAKKPAEVIAFVRTALYVDPRAKDFRIALMALAPLVPARRGISNLRIAHIRALEGCGKVREAIATSRTITDDLAGDPSGLVELAGVICRMKNRVALAPIAERAVEVAGRTLKARRDYLKVRYLVLRLLGKSTAAEEVAGTILSSVPTVELNNFVWGLMKPPDAGHFDRLALLGARRMLRLTRISDPEHDTIARALFLSGFFDEAVANQQKAMRGSKATNPDYRARLWEYERAKKLRDAREAQTGRGKDHPTP